MWLLKECHSHCQEDRKESICVYCHCKKKLEDEDQWIQKEGVWQRRESFQTKLYPPLKNVVEGVHLVKGGNILEYRAKANALLKLNSSHLLTTLALQGV